MPRLRGEWIGGGSPVLVHRHLAAAVRIADTGPNSALRRGDTLKTGWTIPPPRGPRGEGAPGDSAVMTGNLFDRIAEYYDVLHDDVDYLAECLLLEKVFSGFLRRQPASLLDLGCGTGNHALILAKRGCRVTGIDSSAGMLRVARAKARGQPNLVFVRADMRRVDLRRTFVNTNSTRVTSVPVLRRLLASAGMRLVRVCSTDDGAGLRPLRSDDPLPMAVAKSTA